MAGRFVAVLNQLAEKLFAHALIEEPDAVGPDFVEEHATDRCDNGGFMLIAEFGLTLEVRVAVTDPVMQTQSALIKRRMHFIDISQ